MFRIVFICSGNQCRSPAAEAFLLTYVEGLPVEVTSAGTMDISDRAGPSDMVAAVRALGGDMSAHRSRGFGAIDLAGADLVIGFSRHHVATAVVDGGAPAERTFLLRELVRLLGQVGARPSTDPEEMRRTIATAHKARLAGPAFTPDEELDDPIGGPRRVYETSARDIADLTKQLAAYLFVVG
jgi:protein-tyrosine phosphatase